MEDNCIFCKIANGEIPAVTIYEDEMFRVILDVAPMDQGHALILPKRHMRNLFDLDEETASKVFVLAAKIGKAMKKGLGCEGLNILQNNEEIAGQSVFHFHLHVIPRYAHSTPALTFVSGTSDPKEQEILAEKIRTAME